MDALQALKERRAAMARGPPASAGGGDGEAEGAPGPSAPPPPRRVVRGLAWQCSGCDNRECVPIRAESRCLCGHRLKEHKLNARGDAFGCVRVRSSLPAAAAREPPRSSVRPF
jgi:hypothetical protein